MEEHGLLYILPVQPSGQPGQNDHREFQPLGLVDAHQAHRRPLPAGGGGGEGLPVLPQPGQVGKEAEQPLVAGLLELPGALGQRQQVAPPPLPVSHGAENPQQISAVVDLPQKLMAAQLPRQVPQLVQFLQEG